MSLGPLLLDDVPDETQVVPVLGFEDLRPYARHMLDVLNEHRPGELNGLKGELHRFLTCATGSSGGDRQVLTDR